MPVFEQDLAMSLEMVLFQSGGGEDGFGVQEAGKLRD